MQEERNQHRWLGKMESDKLKREHWRKSSQWCVLPHLPTLACVQLKAFCARAQMGASRCIWRG